MSSTNLKVSKSTLIVEFWYFQNCTSEPHPLFAAWERLEDSADVDNSRVPLEQHGHAFNASIQQKALDSRWKDVSPVHVHNND